MDRDKLVRGYKYLKIGKYEILVREDKNSITFRDYGKRGDKRAIVFYKQKGGLAIAIEVPKRRKYEDKNKNMNTYVLYKKQLQEVTKWWNE
jgi:formylmethanofuran dehydrogenase subunit E